MLGDGLAVLAHAPARGPFAIPVLGAGIVDTGILTGLGTTDQLRRGARIITLDIAIIGAVIAVALRGITTIALVLIAVISIAGLAGIGFIIVKAAARTSGATRIAAAGNSRPDQGADTGTGTLGVAADTAARIAFL